MAAWTARENDPAVIDSIAIAETVALAKARFVDIVGDYLSVWADTNGDSDEFTRWLEDIGVLVGREVGDLWRNGEWHAAWFERACRNKLEEALRPLIEKWQSRACGLEILHLDNPLLSLSSVLAADGDVDLAVTFERGAPIATVRRIRGSVWLTESATPSGDGPVQRTERATASSAESEPRSTAGDMSSGSQTAGRPESAATGDTAPHTAPAAAVDESASESAAAPPTDILRLSPARKRANPSRRYSTIDKMLISISDAMPKNHDQVFRFLEERRVRIPHAEPFERCGGWSAGFRSDPQAARAWLSKRWSLLRLPGFQRGPK